MDDGFMVDVYDALDAEMDVQCLYRGIYELLNESSFLIVKNLISQKLTNGNVLPQEINIYLVVFPYTYNCWR